MQYICHIAAGITAPLHGEVPYKRHHKDVWQQTRSEVSHQMGRDYLHAPATLPAEKELPNQVIKVQKYKGKYTEHTCETTSGTEQ